MVKPDDLITIHLPEPPHDKEVIPENIPLDIIFEDQFLMVINKPAGMIVHPGHKVISGTLVNAMIYYFNNLADFPGKLEKPGLVHRIDKATTGLMIIAKEKNALQSLLKQFFYHNIKRTYLTLVWGKVENEKGTIQTNLLETDIKSKPVIICHDNKGKKAITHYQVIEHLDFTTLVRCQLETGRMHQIRVHMKHIGHPVFNDKTYGGDKIPPNVGVLYITPLKGPLIRNTELTPLQNKTSIEKLREKIESCNNLIPGQFLHSHSMVFLHPETKKEMFFEAPLPTEMGKILEILRNNDLTHPPDPLP